MLQYIANLMEVEKLGWIELPFPAGVFADASPSTTYWARVKETEPLNAVHSDQHHGDHLVVEIVDVNDEIVYCYSRESLTDKLQLQMDIFGRWWRATRKVLEGEDDADGPLLVSSLRTLQLQQTADRKRIEALENRIAALEVDKRRLHEALAAFCGISTPKSLNPHAP